MEVSELAALAREIGKDAFVARFPHIFLVFSQDPAGMSQAPFSTQIARREVLRRPAASLFVVPLIKAPQNPYSDRISIGRARNCDVVLRDASVSKLHAHVRREPNGTWVIIDLDSHNGTAVGEQPILPSRPEPLRIGGVVTIGGVSARVVDADQLYAMLIGK